MLAQIWYKQKKSDWVFWKIFPQGGFPDNSCGLLPAVRLFFICISSLFLNFCPASYSTILYKLDGLGPVDNKLFSV